MKSLIVYYSFSGNTRKVAEILAELLRQKGEVEVLELEGLDESPKFLAQALRGLSHKKAKIQEVNFDLGGYDLVCLGTPVWAFGPAPAMNTYLYNCSGLAGRKAVLFITYGSGAGTRHCLNYMQDILLEKRARECLRLSIQQCKVKDREFIIAEIKKVLRLWPNG